MIFGITFLLFLLGLILAITGSCGKRMNDHYICASCGFDLYGLVNCDQDRQHKKCPECGQVLAREHAVIHGKRRRSPLLISIGLGLIMISLIAAITFNNYDLKQINWQPYKPTSWLLSELDIENDRESLPAVQELHRRMLKRDLSDDSLAAFFDYLLDYQALKIDGKIVYNEVFIAARNSNQLTDENWERHLKQWAGFDPKVRKRVSLAEQFFYGLDTSYPINGIYQFEWKVTKVQIGDAKVSSLKTLHRYLGIKFDAFDQPIKPGTHPVKVHYQLSVSDGDNVLHAWSEVLSDQIEILEADTPSLTLVHDAKMAELLKQNFEVTALDFRGEWGPIIVFQGELPPVNLNYDITVDDGANVWRFGQFYHKPNVRWGTTRDHNFPERIDADRVKILFSPTTEGMTHNCDVFEILDTPLVFENVAVKHSEP